MLAVSIPPCGSRWYCVVSQAQQEYRALSHLLAQGFEAYLPLHLDRKPSRERIVPMFSRYLFCRFDIQRDQWRKICSTRGVQSMIWRSSEVPAPLPIGIVEGLVSRTSARRVVDDPGQTISGYLDVGAKGRVSEGPLEGWEGICTMSGTGRVRLLLSMFGGPREVEFKSSAVIEV